MNTRIHKAKNDCLGEPALPRSAACLPGSHDLATAVMSGQPAGGSPLLQIGVRRLAQELPDFVFGHSCG